MLPEQCAHARWPLHARLLSLPAPLTQCTNIYKASCPSGYSNIAGTARFLGFGFKGLLLRTSSLLCHLRLTGLAVHCHRGLDLQQRRHEFGGLLHVGVHRFVPW